MSNEFDFDLAQGLYWYLTDNHGGQGSAEYKMLSKLSDIYRPGLLEKGPRTDEAIDVYEDLESGELDAQEELDGLLAGNGDGPEPDTDDEDGEDEDDDEEDEDDDK
jgi:hypothetical protein